MSPAVNPVSPSSSPSIVRRATVRAASVIYGLFGASREAMEAESVLRIYLKQIPLGILAITALLYLQGRELGKGESERDNFRWAKLLAESGLIYGLMVRTRGVLPLLFLATAALRAGQRKDLKGRVEEVVRTASLIFMGYVGASLGLSYSMHSVYQGVKPLSGALDNAEMRAYFGTLTSELLASTKPEDQVLGKKLKKLGKRLELARKRIEESLPSLGVEKDVNQKVAREARKQLLDKILGPLQRGLSDPAIGNLLEKELDAVTQKLKDPTLLDPAKALLNTRRDAIIHSREFLLKLAREYSSHVRGVRAANPLFGAFIGMFILGSALYKGSMALFNTAMPRLKGYQGPTLVSSDTVFFPKRGRNRRSDLYVPSYQNAIAPTVQAYY